MSKRLRTRESNQANGVATSARVNKKPSKAQLYEVEAFLQRKGTGNGERVLVKWKGYSSAQNTWEPLCNVSHIRHLPMPLNPDVADTESPAVATSSDTTNSFAGADIASIEREIRRNKRQIAAAAAAAEADENREAAVDNNGTDEVGDGRISASTSSACSNTKNTLHAHLNTSHAPENTGCTESGQLRVADGSARAFNATKIAQIVDPEIMADTTDGWTFDEILGLGSRMASAWSRQHSAACIADDLQTLVNEAVFR